MSSLSREAEIGVIAGSVLGGVLLVTGLVIAVCLCCKPGQKKDKKKYAKKHKYPNDPDYYSLKNSRNGSYPNNKHHDKSSPRGSAPSSQLMVPPGVWTSNPAMYAGTPSSAYMPYANGTLGPPPPMPPPPPPHLANGYSNGGYTNGQVNGYNNGHPNGYPNGSGNRYPNGYPNDYSNGYAKPLVPQPNVNGQSWYHRTLHRAKHAIKKSFPTVFQVQQNQENTTANQHNISNGSTPRITEEEMYKTVDITDMTITEKSHVIQPKKAQHSDELHKKRETATARILNESNNKVEHEPKAMTVDDAVGPHIAKIYSNYSLEHIDHGLDEVDEDGLPVTSNSYQYIARAHAGPEFVTQSDWALHKKPTKNVTRSQSNVEKFKVYGKVVETNDGVAKANGGLLSDSRYGGKGVYLRSPSDAQLFAYKRQPTKDNPKHKKDKTGSDPAHRDIIRPPKSSGAINVDKHQVTQGAFVASAPEIELVESTLDKKQRKGRRIAPKPPQIVGPGKARQVKDTSPAHSALSASNSLVPPVTRPLTVQSDHSSTMDRDVPEVIVNQPPAEVRPRRYIDASIRNPPKEAVPDKYIDASVRDPTDPKHRYIDASVRIASTIQTNLSSELDISEDEADKALSETKAVVMREKSPVATSRTRHSNPPDDPNALYAVVDKNRESSRFSRISSHTANSKHPMVSEPTSPVPPPPPPPPLPSPPPGNPLKSPGTVPLPPPPPPVLAADTEPTVAPPPPPTTVQQRRRQDTDKPGQEDIDAAVIAEEEREKRERRWRKKSVTSGEFAVKEKDSEQEKPIEELQITQEAFDFLEDFVFPDNTSLRSLDLTSLTSGRRLTSRAFQFLDRYSIDTNLDNVSVNENSNDTVIEVEKPPMDTIGRSENLTRDAFRFLDEFEDTMSFGDELESPEPEGISPPEHYNY